MWPFAVKEHRYCVPPDQARISIVFDLQTELITGVVCDSTGHSLPFSGWMELTSSIERALDDARRSPDAKAQPSAAVPSVVPGSVAKSADTS
jgi:hypothetical protein